MTADPIRAALDAAVKVLRSEGLGATDDEVAAAVAAFLRAPDVWRALAEDGTDAVAAAVEEAARHD